MKGINVRKIAAFAGAAVLGLSAIAVADVVYGSTQLVDQNGQPTVKVYVGTKAAISDGVAAANIAAKIANEAYKSSTLTASVSGTPTCSVGGGVGGSGTCSLVESSKKGLTIVSSSMVTISQYVDRIRQVNERLQDLMADVSSSMLSQIHFMTPVIAGIVVGISAMIVNIIVALNMKLSVVSFESETAESLGPGGGITALVDLFSISGIIPSYFFQIVVGLYVVQLAYILTVLQNGIENGSDKINEQYLLGKNLIKSFLLYALIAFIVTILFTALAQGILAKDLVS